MNTPVHDAIAYGIHDAGARVVTHVPGFGANQVFGALNDLANAPFPVSFHEEVAYTICHGAGLVGARAATIIKAHGFAKAANSVIDSLSAGTRGGFVCVVFDDREGRHSDNVFDVHAFLDATQIPFVQPGPGEIYPGIQAAFQQSEERALPVAFLVDTASVTNTESFERNRATAEPIEFQGDLTLDFLQPVFGEYQRLVLESKLAGGDWRALAKPPIPTIPEDLPEAWTRHMEPYTPFFEVFKAQRGEIVTGDTGISHLFAFHPYDCFDLSTYMGGSLPLAIGAYLGGHEDVWALTGDFSFLAAGQLGLPEALQRGIPLRVVVFLNGVAAATGGQPISSAVWDQFLQGWRSHSLTIHDPLDTDEIESVLMQAAAAKELRIVVVDYRRVLD